MENIAREYITYARQFIANDCYDKAFDLYIRAFEKCPGMKIQYEPEFRDVLYKLNEILAESNNRMDEIFKNFARALKIFPRNIFMLNEVGKYLYKFGLYNEAWINFQRALKVDGGFVSAEKNLNSIKNLLIPRWHFRMLNDKIRNFAYHDAIYDTLRPFIDSILDLGSGTCIFSMYAYERSPIAITAIDSSKTMTQIGGDISLDNGVSELILLNNDSNLMTFQDIGGKRSLIITEMFDAGLFGEHVLQTILHAWEHLISNVGRVLPKKAEFYVAPVQSEVLNMKYQLTTSIKTILNIPNLNVHEWTNDEPYDSQDIHFFKDLKYLADPQLLIKVDFNDMNDLQEKLTRTEPYKAEFKITEKGQLNNVIGWFTLYLTDTISITTDPRSPNRATAWQQTVFYDNIPRNVIQNQTVGIDFLLNGGKLSMVSDSGAEILKVSNETLRFLNDADYIKMITRCISIASVYLGQIVEISQINIVDFCPFPMFGLMMLMRGANSLTCYAKLPCDKEFIKKILDTNKISTSKANILVGDEWTPNIFGDEKYHAIFTNIFELCGDIDLRQMAVAEYLKESHLLPGGLFMPSDIQVVAQLVSSHWLDINNVVYDENIGTFEVARYLNKFQVSQNFCIDFDHLEYTPLTDPIMFGSCNSEPRSQVANIPIVNTGTANAILCWYHIELMEQMDELSTKKFTSYIDGTVFMLKNKLPFQCGDVINMLRCTDTDGSFKIMMDLETT